MLMPAISLKETDPSKQAMWVIQYNKNHILKQRDRMHMEILFKVLEEQVVEKSRNKKKYHHNNIDF